jgi:hypothetical protein
MAKPYGSVSEGGQESGLQAPRIHTDQPVASYVRYCINYIHSEASPELLISEIFSLAQIVRLLVIALN